MVVLEKSTFYSLAIIPVIHVATYIWFWSDWSHYYEWRSSYFSSRRN